MLNTLIIFGIILFLYIYITAQYKKGEDLEIYEMDYIDNPQLQEVCDIKQPILFEFGSVCPIFFEKMNAIHEHYGSYDINVKDLNDLDAITLPFQSSKSLMESDPHSHYFSENNAEFLEETGLSRMYEHLNDSLKPSFIVNTKYDLLFGSKGATTPFRYHTHYRQFMCVISGSIQVKMSPWKTGKYVNPIKDYERYDFRSSVNVWKDDLTKVRFLDFNVKAGTVLYVPPFWWYSIKYGEGAFISSVYYNSVMNQISNAPDLALYYLQRQNIKKIHKAEKDPIEVKEPPNETLNEIIAIY